MNTFYTAPAVSDGNSPGVFIDLYLSRRVFYFELTA